MAEALSPRRRSPLDHARNLLAYLSFFAVSWANFFVLLLVQVPLWPLDRRHRVALWSFRTFWGRAFFRLCPGWTVTWDTSAVDLARGPFVVTPNHNSVLDIPAAMGLPFLQRVVARSSQMAVAPFGWVMRLAGMIPLGPDRPDLVVGFLRRCGEELDGGISVLIFPEGGRSSDGRLKRFHKGAYRVAQETGRLVLPVAVTGTRSILPKGLWWPPPGPHRILVKALPPLDPRDYPTPEALRDAARASIAAWLAEADPQREVSS